MNKVDEMGHIEILRWSALIEGVSAIYDEAEKMGIDSKRISIGYNPLLKYVDDRVSHYRFH